MAPEPAPPGRARALAPPLLCVRDVEVVFGADGPTETRALDGLTLELTEGDFVTVIGSNGAGKSTLLRVVAGSICPSAGSVLINGRDVTRRPDFKRARWVSHVFQNPLIGTVPQLTLEENLSLADRRGKRRSLRVAVTRERRDRYVSALAELDIGLEKRLKDRIGLLSGGQRQVVALVMATLERPALLLLDEHTAALDPTNHAMVMEVTDRLVGDHNLTVLMVTHHMQTAISHGNRLVMLDKGKVVMELDGEEKQTTTAAQLVERFARLRGTGLDDRIAFSLAEGRPAGAHGAA
jgi:putative ABC transport system ATP-binding protein